jgi:hypothetical protein
MSEKRARIWNDEISLIAVSLPIRILDVIDYALVAAISNRGIAY